MFNGFIDLIFGGGLCDRSRFRFCDEATEEGLGPFPLLSRPLKSARVE